MSRNTTQARSTLPSVSVSRVDILLRCSNCLLSRQPEHEPCADFPPPGMPWIKGEIERRNRA